MEAAKSSKKPEVEEEVHSMEWKMFYICFILAARRTFPTPPILSSLPL